MLLALERFHFTAWKYEAVLETRVGYDLSVVWERGQSGVIAQAICLCEQWGREEMGPVAFFFFFFNARFSFSKEKA